MRLFGKRHGQISSKFGEVEQEEEVASLLSSRGPIDLRQHALEETLFRRPQCRDGRLLHLEPSFCAVWQLDCILT